jgi:sugar lactone lactonase YvrE
MSKTGTLAAQIDPAILAIPAAPTGLAWQADRAELVVADSARCAIVRGEHTLAVLASESGLGAIAITHETGAVFAAADGETGRIFQIDDAHGVRELPALGAAWRLGLACDRAGRLLYVTQFQMSRFGAHDGAIVAIDLATGAASLVLDGFHKPVGIVQLGSTLIVADARARAVYRIALVAGRAVSRLQLAALPDRPEHACACGDDAVLVTSYDPAANIGAVRRIGLDGSVAVVASGAWEPRGIAFDGANAIVSVAHGLLSIALS